MFEYHLTFTTDGTHLQGHEHGSCERVRGITREVEPDPDRVALARASMRQPEFRLTERQRIVVAESIRRTCASRSRSADVSAVSAPWRSPAATSLETIAGW